MRKKEKKKIKNILLKQHIVKTYAKNFSLKLFVETGTYRGKMVNATRHIFERIYSIELDDELFKNAKKKFSEYNHISIIQGDSSKVLPTILSNINQPCLFWLDAHYSEGYTAKGEKETPIIEELHHILNNSKLNHVILIDDARMFKGKNYYTTIKELKKLISIKKPTYSFFVKKDIIRVYKK